MWVRNRDVTDPRSFPTTERDSPQQFEWTGGSVAATSHRRPRLDDASYEAFPLHSPPAFQALNAHLSHRTNANAIHSAQAKNSTR